MNLENQNLTVVGAGLVGSLWAIYLAKSGATVNLFEKRSDPRLEEKDDGRSINLILTIKGMEILKECNLLEKVLELTTPVYGRMMHSKDGELVYQPYGKDDSECNYSISRKELNIFLINQAQKLGVKIHFSSDIEKIDLEKKIIHRKNQDEYSYDVLFGADGAGSIVRKSLLDKVSGSEEKIPLGADYKELLMPSLDGDYPIEKRALHIWPRGAEFLMALPNRDGSFTMTLYMPKSRFEEHQTKEEIKNLFETEYPDSVELMPNYIQEYQNNPNGFLGTVKASPWIYKGEVCLIGDAAHPIVPFFGQGMNSGFFDCLYLSKLMNENENFEDIFKLYFERQKKNGDAIADMAIENYTEMSSKVADPKFLLKKQIEKVLEENFPNSYKSRYGIVIYTLIDYYHAKNLGLIQNELLNELTTSISNPIELNLDFAKSLIEKRLTPYLINHQITF